MSGARGRRAGAPAAAVVVLLLAAAAWAPPALARSMRCNGEHRLCDRPLNEVVLPAAHNAMSAYSLGWQIPNQPVGIPDQLRLGIRGLLVDTHYAHRGADGALVTDAARRPGDRLYLCHDFCQLGATPLVRVLRAIRGFLRAHPDNVVVVINEDYVTPRDFAAQVRRSGLRRHVYRGRPGPRWPTLRRMIARRQQVVMLAEHHAAGVHWYHPAYQGIVQETPYTWATPDLLTRPSAWRASCRPNRGGTTGSLFLMNHWSPPAAPSPATSLAVNATRAIVGRAETCRRVRGVMPNIVAVDMFASGGLLPAVRRLNRAIAHRR